MILQESFQLLIVYKYDFTPWLLTLLLNYVFIKIILLWGKGIWKTLSLACPIIYTGSCNTCICATIPLQFVCFCDRKQDLGHGHWNELLLFPWGARTPVLGCNWVLLGSQCC